jgi:hypothetical protein
VDIVKSFARRAMPCSKMTNIHAHSAGTSTIITRDQGSRQFGARGASAVAPAAARARLAASAF